MRRGICLVTVCLIASPVFAVAQSLRDSFSGVDVNEEAVQLLQFEQAFSAMLRIIQVVDDLSNEVLGLVN